ncbi:hypothetical protein Tco_0557270 [Tanacetum coccineum]
MNKQKQRLPTLPDWFQQPPRLPLRIMHGISQTFELMKGIANSKKAIPQLKIQDMRYAASSRARKSDKISALPVRLRSLDPIIAQNRMGSTKGYYTSFSVELLRYLILKGEKLRTGNRPTEIRANTGTKPTTGHPHGYVNGGGGS